MSELKSIFPRVDYHVVDGNEYHASYVEFYPSEYGYWIRYDPELDSIIKDAERYRWLRDLPEDHPGEEIGNMPGYLWDEMIDEAMEDQK